MALRILWDLNEAAILLDALVKVKEGLLNRSEAIVKVSRTLRARAAAKGVEIDEVFRNIAGIRLQMGIIEYVLTDGESGLYTRSPAKVFKEAVKLYKNDRGKFDLILKQAVSFAADGSAFRDAVAHEPMENRQEKFHNWLAGRVTPAQLSELYQTYEELNSELKRDRILDKSIYDITDEAELERAIKHITSGFKFRNFFKFGMNKKTSALNHFKAYLRENKDNKEPASYPETEDQIESYAQSTAPYAEIKGSLPKADVEDNNSVKQDLEKFNILSGIKQDSSYFKTRSETNRQFNPQSETSPQSSKTKLPEEEDTAKGENFLKWLKNKYRYVKAEEIYFMLADVDAFQRTNKFSDKSIFDITDVKDYDKFFARLKRKGFLKSERTGGYIHTSDSFQALRLLKSYIAETFPEEPEEQIQEQGAYESFNYQNSQEEPQFQTESEEEPESEEAAIGVSFQNFSDQTEPETEAREQYENTIDFNNLNYNYERIKPTHFNFFDETEEDVSDWEDLYVKVMSCLNDEYPDIFKKNRDIRSEDGALIIAGTIGKNEMKSPVKLENGSWYLYIEKSIKPEQALKNIRLMLDKCLIDYENIVIDYEETGESSSDAYAQTAPRFAYAHAEEDEEDLTEAYFNEDTEEEDIAEDIYFGEAFADADPSAREESPAEEIEEDASIEEPVIEEEVIEEITEEDSAGDYYFGEALEGGNSAAEEAVIEEYSEDDAYSETEFDGSAHDYTEKTEEYFGDGETAVLDWKSKPNLTYTKPVSFTYYDEKDIPVNSWRELYSTVIKKLLWDYPGKLEYYINGNFNSGKSYDLSRDFNDLRMPLKVDYGLYLETNLNAKDIFHKLKTIIKICGANFTDITVRYSRKNQSGQRQFAENADALIASDAPAVTENQHEADNKNRDVSGMLFLDWFSLPELNKTRPVRFDYFEEKNIPVKSWTALYVDITRRFLSDFYEYLSPFADGNFHNGKSYDLGRSQTGMMRPRDVGSGLFLETNLTVSNILRKISRVTEICGIDINNLSVYYQYKKQEPSPAASVRLSAEECERLYTDWADENDINKNLIKSCLSVINQAGEFGAKDIWNADFKALAAARKQFNKERIFEAGDEQKLLFSAFWTLAEFISDYKAGKVNSGENAPISQNRSENTRQESAAAASRAENISNIESQFQRANDAPLSPDAERYKSILEKYYSENGYMPGSAISQHKFVNYYFSEYGENPPRSGRALDKEIEAAGIRIGDRILPGLNGSQTALLSDIVGYIDDILDSGISAVYLDAVFEKFKFRVVDELNIYSWSNLTSLLSGFEGKSFIICGNHCRYPGTPVNTEDDVINVIRNYAEPKYVDEISEDAEFITADKLEKILKNHDDIINTGKRTYFYSPNFPLGEEDVKQIASLLDDNVGRGVNLSSEELKTLIDNNLPYVSQSIEEFETSALIKFLKSKLDSRFDFNGTKISSLNSGVSLSEAIREFARSQREFTLSELEAYINDINANPALWYKALDGAVRVSEDLFVNKEHISFDSDAIDAVLENYVTDNYISIQDVTIFLSFPSVGYPWTPYLLESYVKGYSKKFKLIHPSFAKYGVSGAIVRKSFSANDMHSLAADILSKDLSHGFEADSALEYLVETGYMNRKTMYDIDEVLAEAKQKYLSNLE